MKPTPKTRAVSSDSLFHHLLSRPLERAWCWLVLLTLCFSAPLASGQSYNVTTISGVPGVAGTGSTAGIFNSPRFLARDSTGNLYVADGSNHTIRKVTPGGVVSTLAGLAGTSGSTDGAGAAARFNSPWGVAVDAGGIVYVTDTNNHTIRKIAGSTVTTLAGTAGSSGSADGVGAAARFNQPTGLVVDGSGNLFVVDTNNYIIRKIVIATGAVTTFVGQAGSFGSVDATGTAARINLSYGLAMDGSSNLILADYFNNSIRRITPAGVVTTIAGQAGSNGSADGLGSAARFNSAIGVVVDGTSNTIFVGEYYNNTIRRITPDGNVTTLCGSPSQYGTTNGVGSNARLANPAGLITDGTSNTLLIAESGGNTIRRVSTGGAVSSWLGTPGLTGSADSTGSFSSPYSTAVDTSGNVYVADAGNHVIRKVTPAGQVTTLAGSIGSSGSTNGTGAAAKFNAPAAVAVDGSGNVFVGDTSNHTVRKITPGGVVTTLAGLALTAGTTDGTGNAARFSAPYGITVDATGTNVYVTDFSGNTVRKVVVATGVVTTLAGLGGTSGSVDGTGNAARFNGPVGVALAPGGTFLYVADYNGQTIRKVVIATGVATTVAGTAGSAGNVDGVGAAARFFDPRELACDGAGNLYITDQLNHAVRKMTPAGLVTTLAGGAGSGAVDGVGSAARFLSPAGVCRDAGGNLFIGDEGNHAIRKVTPGGVVTTFAGELGKSGIATAGNYNQPTGISRQANGTLYVADRNNHAIRKVTPEGVITTLAGLPGTSGTADGSGSTARFDSPFALAVSNGGTVYVADTNNHTIRKVTSLGAVTTLAGLANTAGTTDGTGTTARFNSPYGIAVDSTETNLYVVEFNNHSVRKVVISTGVVTTIAGLTGTSGEVDGTGNAARFGSPVGIAIDATNTNLYVGDFSGQTIRKVVISSGVVTTLAGLANTAGEVDGTGNAARFYGPGGVAVDASGNVFVSDTNGDTLRKITPAGVVTTLAGFGNSPGSVDGIGNAVRFSGPAGLAVDAAGVLYIGDRDNHTIRKAVRASAKAQIVSPSNGAVLADPVTTFTWNAGVGASGYALWVGTAPMGYDLYAGYEGTNLSRTVTLPPDRKIYVTLYTVISGVYYSNNYIYEPAPSSKAVLTSPANGATLANGTLNIQWSPGVGCSGYAIWLGSSPGGYDLGAAAVSGTTWSHAVPTDGGPVYVTLYSLINGAYQANTYWLKTAALDAQRPAQITSHANTSTLPGTNVTFGWGNAVGATGYALWVGSTPDGYDLYAGDEGVNVAKNLTLPGDGRRIYVTLHSKIGGVYLSNAYWFTCANLGANAGAAKITSHTNGATFGAALTTLQWGATAGATKYLLWVGTQPSGYDLYAGDEGTNLSRQLNMPNDGRPVYVTLYTINGGVLLSNSYYFTCANTAAGNKPSLITSPINGTGIAASTTFNWGGGSGVTGYALWVGSSPGGYDLYAGNEGIAVSRTLTLPTDGRRIYVTLHSLIGGVYQPVSYFYYASGASPMSITTPISGATFASTSATFNWTSGASLYVLYIGRTPRSYDLYVGNEGTNLNKTITGLLPNDGGPVYVTLYSVVNGVYLISDHIYNAWQQP